MLYGIIRRIFRNSVYKRNDYSDSVYYFSAADFPGLSEEKYEITASGGHTLFGRFYRYAGAPDQRIIIFEHGMGAGHKSYMKEIELLCRGGYTVFAYDHTGSGESGGDSTGGFVGSLIDLNDVLSALKADPRFLGASYSIVGHSWGGFSAMNIAAFHPDVTHVVALSGFISVEAIIKQYAGKIPFGMAKRLYAEELQNNEKFVSSTAERALGGSSVKALIIHSRDDKTVSAAEHFDKLREALSNNQNISFIELSDREHNPNYTRAAIEYKKEFFKAHNRIAKRLGRMTKEEKLEFISGFDFDKMTEQDTELWGKILEFLEK